MTGPAAGRSSVGPQTVALVTGASSGIGAEFAKDLAHRGAGKIILVARREDRLRALAEQIGPQAVVHAVDLTDSVAVDALLQQHPHVDLLVNNAGFGWGSPITEQVDQSSRLLEMIDLNCKALLQLTTHYLPGMIEKRSGWILNVGSIAGMVPMPTMATYCATKAFVHFFTEALRVETRGTGVRVHLLAPGPVETEFFAVAHPGHDRPMGGLFRSPQKVAKEANDALLHDKARLIPGLWVRWAFGALAMVPMPLIRPLAFIANTQLRKVKNPDHTLDGMTATGKGKPK